MVGLHVSAITLLASQNLRGLQITGIGVGVVFLVLGLLWLVLLAFHRIFGEDEESVGPAAPEPGTRVQPEAPIETEAPPLDARLSAAITAAVIHALGRIPEAIEIRRGGQPVADRKRTAAVVAAALAHLSETPASASIDIRKV